MRDDAFEIVCRIADQQNWCWNLFCTTCGHCTFRSALWELAMGRHPDDMDWVTGRPRGDRVHGDLVDFPRSFPLDSQSALSRVLAPASIRNIAMECSFPDWLGYLGVALKYTECDEGRTRRLTKAWLPQLDMLLPERSVHRLRRLDGEGVRITLGWMSLGIWEQELEGGPYARLRQR